MFVKKLYGSQNDRDANLKPFWLQPIGISAGTAFNINVDFVLDGRSVRAECDYGGGNDGREAG